MKVDSNCLPGYRGAACDKREWDCLKNKPRTVSLRGCLMFCLNQLLCAATKRHSPTSPLLFSVKKTLAIDDEAGSRILPRIFGICWCFASSWIEGGLFSLHSILSDLSGKVATNLLGFRKKHFDLDIKRSIWAVIDCKHCTTLITSVIATEYNPIFGDQLGMFHKTFAHVAALQLVVRHQEINPAVSFDWNVFFFSHMRRLQRRTMPCSEFLWSLSCTFWGWGDLQK